MDNNTLAGFGLIMLLLVGYVVYNQNAQMKYQEQRKKDSIANAKIHPPTPAQLIDTNKLKAVVKDTTVKEVAPQTFVSIENEEVKVTLTNMGAYPTKIELKKFKTYDGKPLLLFDAGKNNVDFSFKNSNGSIIHTKAEAFSINPSNDNKKITFSNSNSSITYSLEDKGYMVGIKMAPLTADKTQNITLDWNTTSTLTEKDITTQQQYTHVSYNLEKEGFEQEHVSEKQSADLKDNVKWVSFKQHYFNTTLIPENNIITGGKVSYEPMLDTTKRTLSFLNASLTLKPTNTIDFKLFAGPNDYNLLKSYNKELEEIVPLSYGIFGFVKYINKWIIVPIFFALAKIFKSYGIVILLLTFIIRLLMSPFTYKSYVSSAKMKALKPDLDKLKEKLGDDKQAMGVEQMKLYREAGVNPLGGCLPALLQLPVFFALLSFFPQSIELRQSSFLWAKDLSTYDSIINLPFNIPFYGDHVSLFTLLFVITSLLLALYSMNMSSMGDQNNPMMKYMPFIMPVMFLGIFNKLPASLTFYYFVSNVITLALQFVIQQWIIDPDKIHAQIQAKRSEAPKENKLMKRMMEMQQQQQERAKKK